MSVLLWIVAGLAALLLLAFVFARVNAARAVAAVPKIGRVSPVSGGAIHWVESGSGRPVVCIHGLSSNLRAFTYAMTPMLEQEFRVIALDRPGCGYSERDGAAQASLAEQARMVVEFLDSQGIERPILVGHSLGGALSLQIALDYPEKVAGLTLLAPATMPISEPPAVFAALRVSSGLLRNLLGHTLAGALAPVTAAQAAAFVFSPEKPLDDFLTKGGAALALRPRGYISSSEDLIAVEPSLHAMAERYGALKTPGVLLYGVDDKVLDAKLHGETFAAGVPSIDYVELQGPGHMLPLTEPEKCVEMVRRVAAKSAAAPASESV